MRPIGVTSNLSRGVLSSSAVSELTSFVRTPSPQCAVGFESNSMFPTRSDGGPGVVGPYLGRNIPSAVSSIRLYRKSMRPLAVKFYTISTYERASGRRILPYEARTSAWLVA